VPWVKAWCLVREPDAGNPQVAVRWAGCGNGVRVDPL